MTTQPYQLTIKVNNKTFSRDTANLKEALLKFNSAIHTEMYIMVKRGTADFTRRLTLNNARRLFREPEQIDIFLTNIQF